MPKALLVLPSLDYGGAARQVCLLAAGLPREGIDVRVCALGGPAPWADELAAAGVVVAVLGWTRPFDVWPLAALRRLLRSYRPEVVHAWGPAALRVVAAFRASGGSPGAAAAGTAPRAATPGHRTWRRCAATPRRR